MSKIKTDEFEAHFKKEITKLIKKNKKGVAEFYQAKKPIMRMGYKLKSPKMVKMEKELVTLRELLNESIFTLEGGNAHGLVNRIKKALGKNLDTDLRD